MTLIERLFVLKQCPIFQVLDDSELTLIANIAVSRRFRSGEIVLEQGAVPTRLAILPSSDDHGIPIVIGFEELVLGRPAAETIAAPTPDGVTSLVISRGHFFTIINDCPKVLISCLSS